MRLLLLSMLVMFLCIFAWKDWYKSLCGLIVMMAVIGHESMPSAMFGVVGLNPSNMLFLCIVFSWMVSKKKERLDWDMPRHMNGFLILYLCVVFFSLVRYFMNEGGAAALAMEIGRPAPSVVEMFADNLINSLKWVLPGLLLFHGCNSRERFSWAVVSLLIMYILLALLVVRWMPLGLLTDGDALQRRAARVLNREIGYYRTNLSVMLAGASWMLLAAAAYFDRKYTVMLYGSAGVVTLAMLLTAGRGGYLAWAVIGLVVSFVRYRKYLFLAPPLIALMVAFVPSIQERLLFGLSDNESVSMRDSQDQMSTVTAGRTLVWPKVVDAIAEQPVLGYGFRGIVLSGVSLETYLEYKHVYFHPHNAYLQVLIDLGGVGSLPILLFFYFFIKYSWSLFRDARSPIFLYAGALGFASAGTVLVASVSGQSFYPEERSFGLWCVIGLVLRVYVERLKASPQEKRKWKRKKGRQSDTPIDIWPAPVASKRRGVS